MNQKEKLTFTQHSTLRCGHNLRCCNSHVKRTEKRKIITIKSSPLTILFSWALFSMFGIPSIQRGGRIPGTSSPTVTRLRPSLDDSTWPLEIYQFPLCSCKFFLIESSRHMPDSIRFDSILLLALLGRRLDTFPILYCVTKLAHFYINR